MEIPSNTNKYQLNVKGFCIMRYENRKNATNTYFYAKHDFTKRHIFTIYFYDKSKKFDTVKKHFEKWIKKQPFYTDMLRYGFLVEVYNIFGEWCIHLTDDMEMWQCELSLADKVQEIEGVK